MIDDSSTPKMTEADAKVAYNARCGDISLTSAANYLSSAIAYAARANDGLFWVKDALKQIAYAKERIEEFERFASAIEARDPALVNALLQGHEATVQAAMVRLDREGL